MTEKLKNIGALSTVSNGKVKTVASGLAILTALALPGDVEFKVVAAGALSHVFDYILPARLPWKKQ